MSDKPKIPLETLQALEEPRMKLIQNFVDGLVQMNAVLGGSQCYPAMEAHLMFLATLDAETRERVTDVAKEFMKEAGDPKAYASFQEINMKVVDFFIEKGIYKFTGEKNESSEIDPIDQEAS